MTLLTTLEESKTRIEDPDNWWAGKPGPKDGGTKCAVTALDGDHGIESNAMKVLDQAAIDLFRVQPEDGDGDTSEGWAAILVNDTLGHKAVMQMYDRAMELVKEGLA